MSATMRLTVCRSKRIKLLLGSIFLLCLLQAFKTFYLDSSTGVEPCHGPACPHEFGARHSSLDHPVAVKVPANPHLLKPWNNGAATPHLNTPVWSYRQAPPLSAEFHNLTGAEIKSLERFVFFIGYGRSGHSIVGSIMDAHPNIIIADEYYLFDKLIDARQQSRLRSKSALLDELYQSSHQSAVSGWRANKETSKGYNLHINGSWQGQFEGLKVIGDKTGGSTAMLYHKSPKVFKDTLKLLKSVTDVPYSALHIVRNPYDMIATVALFHASSDPDLFKVNASLTNKFDRPTMLGFATNVVLTKAAAVKAMTQDCHLKLLEVHLEDLITTPATVIWRICEFLSVPCDDGYVRACQQKVYSHISRSRDLVVWTEAIKKKVEDAIHRFHFFNRYSFVEER